jgi:Uma2 family endonuclease
MYDSMLRETSAYQISALQDEFTVEDYLELPEEERMELIDGVIYDLGAPTDKHQIIGDEIQSRFRDYIRKEKGKCITITSPIDVQLDCDNRTMVQPDVVIVCDRNKFKNGRIFGAPDLVVEVLSNSTKKKDIFIKGEKYWSAGVREYWLVDPLKKMVTVYKYEDEDFQSMYTFEDKVPVGIWNDECEVDFSEIYDYIRFLYEEND